MCLPPVPSWIASCTTPTPSPSPAAATASKTGLRPKKKNHPRKTSRELQRIEPFGEDVSSNGHRMNKNKELLGRKMFGQCEDRTGGTGGAWIQPLRAGLHSAPLRSAGWAVRWSGNGVGNSRSRWSKTCIFTLKQMNELI